MKGSQRNHIGEKNSQDEVRKLPVEKEEFYRIITNRFRDVVWTSDLNLNFLFVSESVKDLLGYTSDEFLEMKISDLLTPDYVKIVTDTLAQAIEMEYKAFQYTPVNLELEASRKDGSKIWIEVSTTFLRDENNVNKAILGVIRDITERRSIEVALRKSETKYRTLVEDSVEGISVAVPNPLHFVFVNPALAEMLGYSVDEMLSLNPEQVQDIIHPEDRASFFEGFQNRIQGPPDNQRYIYRALRKDGNVIWLELTASLIDYNGTPAVQGTFVDITEQKMMQALLEESEERYVTLSDAVFEAVFITEKGVCIGANRAAARMFGWNQGDFIGLFGTEVIAEEDKECVKEHILSEYEEPYEATAVKKDGTRFPVEIQARMMDYQGRRVRVTAVKDISKRREVEETLHEREEKYRTVLKSMQDMIFVYDKHNCYSQIYANDESLLFASAKDLIGKCLTDVMPKEMYEQYLRLISKIRESGGSYSYDYQVIIKGEPHWYTSILSLHEDGESIVSVARDITDRKKVELMLKESEEKFRGMAEATPAAIFVRVGPKFVYANETASRISGYSIAELSDMEVGKLVHPDQHMEIQGLMNKRDKGDSNIYHFEMKLVTKTGEIKWMDFWSSLIEYDEKIASISSAIDITEKKQIDDALRTSQAFLAEAQRIAHVGSWDWDVINDVGMWSEETCRIFDVDYKTFMPSYDKFLEMIHPDDRDDVRKAVQESLNSGATYSIDHRIIRPDGSVRFVHEEGETTFDDRGRPIRMFGTIADITDRIQAENLLKESELRYRTFVQNFRGVAYQRYRDFYKPIFFHGTVEEITGFTAEDFVKGRVKWTDIVDEDSIDIVIEEINKLKSIDGYVADAEYMIRTKDGELRWIRDTAQSVQYSEYKEPLIQGVLYDITARKAAERATQEARTRAEFFNDLMAHDLNNIHQGLMAALELLITDVELPSKLVTLAQNALAQVERSITLIRSVRKFSSIQSELQPIRTMDLYDTFKDSFESIKLTFPDRVIEINTNLAPRKFRILANDLLFDVFYNIFHNSVKFDTNGFVVLDVTAKHIDDENALLIRIDDRGPGIAPSRRQSVLDRLKRNETSSSGIGLTLVKQIIEKFHGLIWIEDRVPGNTSQGTSFVFKLPRG